MNDKSQPDVMSAFRKAKAITAQYRAQLHGALDALAAANAELQLARARIVELETEAASRLKKAKPVK